MSEIAPWVFCPDCGISGSADHKNGCPRDNAVIAIKQEPIKRARHAPTCSEDLIDPRVVVLREQHRKMIETFSNNDPCPQCGEVNPEWRRECIHHYRDDEFGLPLCEF